MASGLRQRLGVRRGDGCLWLQGRVRARERDAKQHDGVADESGAMTEVRHVIPEKGTKPEPGRQGHSGARSAGPATGRRVCG